MFLRLCVIMFTRSCTPHSAWQTPPIADTHPLWSDTPRQKRPWTDTLARHPPEMAIEAGSMHSFHRCVKFREFGTYLSCPLMSPGSVHHALPAFIVYIHTFPFIPT